MSEEKSASTSEEMSIEELRRLVEEFKREFAELDEQEVMNRLKEIGELVLDVAEEDDTAWDTWFEVEKFFSCSLCVSEGCDDYAVVLVDEDNAVAYFVVIAADEVKVYIIRDSEIEKDAAEELAHFLVQHQPWRGEVKNDE